MKTFVRVLLALFFSYLFFETSAQNIKTDSLFQVLRTTKQDSNKIIALFKISESRGWRRGNNDTALMLINQALALAEKSKYEKGFAMANHSLGTVSYLQGNFSKAMGYYIKAIDLYEKFGNQRAAASCYLNMGVAYDDQGVYSKALEYYFKALKVFEEIGYKQGSGSCYINIGVIYEHQKNHAKALECYFRALKIDKELNDKHSLAGEYNNLANVYVNQKMYDTAFSYYSKSFKLREEINDRKGLSDYYSNTGFIYSERKNYTQALNHYFKSLSIRNEIGDKNGIIRNYINLSEVYCKLGDYKKSISYADSALTLNKEINSIENARLAYQNLSQAYQLIGNYKAAFDAHVKFKELNDSIYNEQNSKLMSDLKINYEVEKKDKEIAYLQSQHELKQIIYFVIGLALLAIMASLIIFFSQKRKVYHANQALAQLREADLQKELEYKNRELASYTVNFIQKNKLMEEMKEKLSAIKDETSETVSKKINDVKKIIDSNYQIDKEWEDFKTRFEKVHPVFFEKLRVAFPDLTQNDLKLCALLKLNLNIKESAKILGISPDSMKTARYRLRKKLQLHKDDGLFDFMQNIENDAT